MIKFKQKQYGYLKDLKENPRETIRKTGHDAVNYAVDNPVDTAAWAAGDVYLPTKIAEKLGKKVGGGWKGTAVRVPLYAYAASPFGLTTAAIVAKNKYKEKKKKKKEKKFSRIAYFKEGPKNLEDLTDSQLENMSKYKNPSKWWKHHVEYPGHVMAGTAGGILGYFADGSRGAALGSIVGAGTSKLGHMAAHHHNKKNAEEARRILQERKLIH